MDCRDVRSLIPAFVDGELDLVRHLQVEHHLAECGGCADEEQGLRQFREALAAPGLRYHAPNALRLKVEAALPRGADPAPPTPAGPRMRRTAVLVGTVVGVVQIAASLAAGVFLARPSAEERFAEQVTVGHVRSLQVAHATDVVSSDQHTVKPWFLGKVDFSPRVPDLSSRGYALSGGRLDYLADHPSAALVYRRRGHLINVFTWADTAGGDDRPVRSLRRNGFHIRHWQQSGVAYWAISDLNPQELDEFVDVFRGPDAA